MQAGKKKEKGYGSGRRNSFTCAVARGRSRGVVTAVARALPGAAAISLPCMLTIPTLSAAHKKGTHTMQAIGLLADMGHDGTAAHRGQGVQRDMPGVACNVTGGGGRCEQLQFGRYTAVGHCDCGPHGVCEPLTGECLCQWGWAGKQCEVAAFPACGLGAELSRAQLAASCASMRLLSPVACACLAQCLDAGHEVCAHGSMGSAPPRPRDARHLPQSCSRRRPSPSPAGATCRGRVPPSGLASTSR